MSDLLAIGSSAVMAYRNALSAVGDNVANAETPGYVRRSVLMSEAPVTGHRASVRFNGVVGDTVVRGWDGFLASEVRDATGAAAASETERLWLQRIETALDDGPGGVGQSITAVFTSAQRLAADPASQIGRTQFLTAIDTMATGFRDTAAALRSLASGVRASIDDRASAVTQTLASLDAVNRQIRVTSPGSSERAGLDDQRDTMLATLAGDIRFSSAIADDGSVAVTSLAVPTLPLLDGRGAARLVVGKSGDGEPVLMVTSDRGSEAFVPDGGALAGLDAATSAIADAKTSLDRLANDSATLFNAWSRSGIDASGATGRPLLLGDGADGLAAVTLDPGEVAAASSIAANGNLLALATVRTDGAIERRWSDLVADNAQSLASVTGQAQAQTILRDNALLSLDAIGGVDLDREAADLVRLQQAYGGAARILAVARDMLDTLLNATR